MAKKIKKIKIKVSNSEKSNIENSGKILSHKTPSQIMQAPDLRDLGDLKMDGLNLKMKNRRPMSVFQGITIGLVIAGLFSFGIYVFAVPPTSTYDPGETLNPSCNPGDTNCKVTGPVPYTGATAALDLGAQNFTTTGIATQRTLRLSGSTSGYVGLQGAAVAGTTTYTLPAADGTSGQFLQTNGTGALAWASSSPGGATTQVQFNTSSAFDGDAEFVWNTTTKLLTVTGQISAFEAGLRNEGFGSGALAVVATGGNDNTALGYNALTANTTGTRNTGVGTSAMITSTIANDVTGLGYNVLNLNTGNNNTAIGSTVLDTNSTGADNTGVGYAALTANTTGGNNVAMGSFALTANTTGGDNVAMGYNALGGNTTGGTNTAMGRSALSANTTGDSNIAMGYSALSGNTTGTRNTGIGTSAMLTSATSTDVTGLGYNVLNLNTGSFNTAIGSTALDTNSTGANNTGIGYAVLTANTTASNNTALGYNALTANTTGTQNTAIGSQALQVNTTAINNTGVGWNALAATTTGGSNTAIGSNAGQSNTTGDVNTAVGNQALQLNTTGQGNTVIGYLGLQVNTTASWNTGVGYSVMKLNTTGAQNTALGTSALDANTTGNNNVAVGYDAGGLNTTGSSNIFLGRESGDTATITDSNMFIAGSTSYAINNVWFGKGVVNATPTTYTINGTGGSGTNIAGAALQIAGGKGTGNAAGGSIIFQTSAAGATGTTLQSLTEDLRLSGGIMQPSKAAADAVAYAINSRKARGTVAAPTVITTGDDLLTISGYGYVGAVNTYQEAANITIDSAGTIADTATGVGGVIRFNTAAVGAEPTERFAITNTGELLVAGSAGTSGQVLTSGGASAAPSWAAAGALSALTAATATNTIANGTNSGQVWNWALTANSVNAFTFGETTAATGGTSTAGVPNQVLLRANTLAASTMSPLSVYSRGNHVFSVSPTTSQILATNGSNLVPAYSFAGDSQYGLWASGGAVFITSGALDDFTIIDQTGDSMMMVNRNRMRIKKGTAASPGLQGHAADANTGDGIWWPAANTLATSVAGVENFRIAAGVFQPSQAAADVVAYAINSRKARGTVASPTVITTGDDLLTVSGYGYVGAVNTYVEAANILIDSTGTIADTTTGVGGIIRFNTRAVGGAMTEAFRVQGGTAPQILAANGTIAAPAYSFANGTNAGFAYDTAGAQEISVMIGGVQRIQIRDTQIYVPAGSAGTIGLTDNTSANAGLFWPAAGVLGISVTQLENSRFIGASGTQAWQPSNAGAVTTAYAINSRKARGTVAAPTVITTGDDLLTVSGYGYVGAVNTYQEAANITIDSAGTIADTATGVGGVIRFNTAAVGAEPTERVVIDNAGNVGIGTASFGTNAVGVLGIKNGTIPASSPVDMVQLYAEDIVASSELRVRDEAGNVTTLSPHNFTLFTPEKDYVLPWSFTSENAVKDIRINVDMYGAVQALEALTGKEFIHAEKISTDEMVDRSGERDNSKKKFPSTSTSEGFHSTGMGATISQNVAAVKDAFSSLGLIIVNGIANLQELVAQKITVKEAQIKTADVENLQLKDKATGEIYCAWIADGEWVKVKKECSNVVAHAPAQVIVGGQFPPQTTPTPAPAPNETAEQLKQILDETQKVISGAKSAQQSVNQIIKNVTESVQNAADEAAKKATQQIKQQLDKKTKEKETEEKAKPDKKTEGKAEIETKVQTQLNPAPAKQTASVVRAGDFIKDGATTLFEKMADFAGWIIVKITPDVVKNALANVTQGSQIFTVSLIQPTTNVIKDALDDLTQGSQIFTALLMQNVQYMSQVTAGLIEPVADILLFRK